MDARAEAIQHFLAGRPCLSKMATKSPLQSIPVDRHKFDLKSFLARFVKLASGHGSAVVHGRSARALMRRVALPWQAHRVSVDH